MEYTKTFISGGCTDLGQIAINIDKQVNAFQQKLNQIGIKSYTKTLIACTSSNLCVTTIVHYESDDPIK